MYKRQLLDYGRFGETDAMQWIYRTFPQVAHETLGVDDFGKGFANGWAAGGSNVMKGGAPDAYDGTMPAEKVDDKSKSLGIARPNGG